MNIQRLIELKEIFLEPEKDLDSYLRGISKRTLLEVGANTMGYLNFLSPTPFTFADDIGRFLSPRNQSIAERIFHQISAIEKRERSTARILQQKTALQFFQHAWNRPDESETQQEEDIEINILKAYLLLNTKYIEQQSVATSGSDETLGISKLAAWALSSTFSDFELINHNTPNLFIIQLIKAVNLFLFLESDNKYSALLQAFLRYYNSSSWQDYLQSLLAAIKFVTQVEKPQRLKLEIKPGSDFKENYLFLFKHALGPKEELITSDFTSLRGKPFYQERADTFVLLHPVLAIEMLHKGLYFRLKDVNATLPNAERISNWRSQYCDLFSEQFLLYPVLDNVFSERGTNYHGADIKETFKNDGYGEPDEYYRLGNCAILFESKDALPAQESKAGHSFSDYVKHLKRSFYYDNHDGKGKIDNKATLQLRRNIVRLLQRAFTFDKDYDSITLTIYSVVVVHDRLYNQPGLNVLVNEWFQQGLAELPSDTPSVQNVRPLIIIDIDTLISYQEHFRDQKMIFEDTLEKYINHVNPDMNSARGLEQEAELKKQMVIPYALFLENHAGEQGLKPVPEQTLHQAFLTLSQGRK